MGNSCIEALILLGELASFIVFDSTSSIVPLMSFLLDTFLVEFSEFYDCVSLGDNSAVEPETGELDSIIIYLKEKSAFGILKG